MKRLYSAFAIGLVTVSASIGAVIASSSTVDDQTPPTALRVVESSEVFGAAQPGIELRRPSVSPAVNGLTIGVQPGVPQPEVRTAKAAGQSGSLIADAQPGVEIRGTAPGSTTETASAETTSQPTGGLLANAQPGVEIRDTESHSPTETSVNSNQDWTALAFAAGYDQYAADSLAAIATGGDA